MSESVKAQLLAKGKQRQEVQGKYTEGHSVQESMTSIINGIKKILPHAKQWTKFCAYITLFNPYSNFGIYRC